MTRDVRLFSPQRMRGCVGQAVAGSTAPPKPPNGLATHARWISAASTAASSPPPAQTSKTQSWKSGPSCVFRCREPRERVGERSPKQFEGADIGVFVGVRARRLQKSLETRQKSRSFDVFRLVSEDFRLQNGREQGFEKHISAALAFSAAEQAWHFSRRHRDHTSRVSVLRCLWCRGSPLDPRLSTWLEHEK